ncbi:hypothetical protein GQX73_g6084 [Xylaria multiplex]|uniref:2EXR domain-containing protein n=1 Tax=Xylaria multiplex TaxID=323545 RepID=A0A7C8IMH9_9PEZI|nr:hypothetical protein GQX73_g6084 [Xylaria multiplex]
MSDRSDQEDDLASDVADSPVEQDSDESETDQGNGFLDMEAEESDGYDEDEDEDENHDEDHDHSDHGSHVSFPQFSRLPPELRVMIWEAVDPYLKSKGRVLEFSPINMGDFDYQLFESLTLSQQTAPARMLLATNKESRRIALQHYPDTIRLHGELFDVRFNGSQDIILLREAGLSEIAFGLEDWSDKIKYLALDHNICGWSDPLSPNDDLGYEEALKTLKAVFYCFDVADLDSVGRRKLDWSVSESSKQFYIDTYEESPGLGEDYETLYCWPDTTLHADFVDRVGEDYMLGFPPLPAIYGIPTWPMVQYSFESGLDKYHRVKRRYERNIGREAGSASPHESSEGESFYESEPDDYARDDFVVDTSSEGEESSEDEDEGVHIDGPHDDYDDLSGEDGGEDGVQLAQDYVFNGFSPLQEESSDDEPTENLPNTVLVVRDLESPDDDLSNASSHEEQPRTIAQTGRRKRHIVSSDDEDDGEDGGGPIVETSSRAKKRARAILSDSEDGEGGGENGTRSATEGSSRLKKRVRTVLSDSEGEEDERPGPPDDEMDEDEDEDDEDDEATEGADDESEEESRVSKPMSLLARLRQFRSDVPIPPEGEFSDSGEEFEEEERYEDDEGRRPSDAEFPESAGEDEEEGW